MEQLQGELVRLAALDADVMAEAEARWSLDTEYWRLRYPTPARPRSVAALRAGWQSYLEELPTDSFFFAIRVLADDRLIGDGGLFDLNWANGEAEVGIGIGERDYWSRGYGTDAMRLLLRYAFTELNLHRVTLTVLGANPRARRAYEKAGFRLEGVMRGQNQYAGRRVDEVCMGILRDEWIKSQIPMP